MMTTVKNKNDCIGYLRGNPKEKHGLAGKGNKERRNSKKNDEWSEQFTEYTIEREIEITCLLAIFMV